MILSIFHFKKEGYIMCDTIMFKTNENIKKGIEILYRSNRKRISK